MRTSSQRIEYAGIDYFRMAAALLVVAIHTSPLSGVSEIGDFVLTRIFARVAVPFFFMASGFFLFSKKKGKKMEPDRMEGFHRKTVFLYGITVLLYLPLNFYTGTVKEWRYLPNLLRDLLFNGTFYHLWYLPAAITGACITWLLLKHLKTGQAFLISLILYLVGLLGDSYYGISEKIPFLKAVYQNLFIFFDYTRNGFFFAPVFILMGALLAGRIKRLTVKVCLTGTAVSFGLMLLEGLLLHSFKLQRHDSMYIMLLPCMFFLFQGLLLWKGKSVKSLRNASMIIYLVHPAVIVAVRGAAKITGLEKLLIDNSVLHFLTVAVGSIAVAGVWELLTGKKHRPGGGSVEGNKKQRAWAEINLSNLGHNAEVLKNFLPAECEIMAVVKANAYGHGDVRTSVFLNRRGISAFAVASADEGIHLRKEGIKGEILILGYTSPDRVPDLVRYRLSQTVADVEHARELNSWGRPVQIHIKVDTGMNRLGESYQHVSEIASVFNCRNLKAVGIFTHLCCSDSRKETSVDFTKRQIQYFYELLELLEEKGIRIPKTHIQSSYGVLNYPELKCSYARMGIALYGVLSEPDQERKKSYDLMPVLALKSRIVLVRTIGPGETVGYGREFMAERETRIAVISIGYADGYPRSLSDGKGHVLIQGHRVPVIGRICMDQMMADVTGIPGIEKGDVVTLIGKEGQEEISAEEVAAAAGTITNELLSRLNSCRLERENADLTVRISKCF